VSARLQRNASGKTGSSGLAVSPAATASITNRLGRTVIISLAFYSGSLPFLLHNSVNTGPSRRCWSLGCVWQKLLLINGDQGLPGYHPAVSITRVHESPICVPEGHQKAVCRNPESERSVVLEAVQASANCWLLAILGRDRPQGICLTRNE
jgi:hypothetical protein